MADKCFDYFTAAETGQFSFYRIPKALFTGNEFQELSCEAKVLYGMMLDRMGLSIRNQWFDSLDRAYIIFTVEDVMRVMGCRSQKAVRLMKELDTADGIGLIEKKRIGLGRPSRIYVKQGQCPVTAQELPEPQKMYFEKQHSVIADARVPEFRNTKGNDTEYSENEYSESEYSETEKNNTGFSAVYQSCQSGQSGPACIQNIRDYDTDKDRKADSAEAKMDAYRETIRENISYSCFHSREAEDVDELVELMVDAMMVPDRNTIRIEGSAKPASVVKSRFMKLMYQHIEYVLECLNRYTGKIHNIKAYLITALYNSTMMISSYYRAEVNHDLYGQ